LESWLFRHSRESATRAQGTNPFSPGWPALHRFRKGPSMKLLVAPTLALSLALSSTAAFAGGPVVIEEEFQPVVVEETPRSGWIVPVLIGGIILCAIACGGDDDDDPAPQ
jgi:hypothetical protein